MLRHVPLQWKWFLGLTGLIGVLLLLVAGSLHLLLPELIVGRIQRDLERQARLVGHAAAPLLLATPPDTVQLNRTAHELSRLTGLRVTLLTADGTVVGESDKPLDALATIENHRQRREVQEALAHQVGTHRRRSDTMGVELLYVAVPVRTTAGQLIGVARVALPLDDAHQTTNRANMMVATTCLLVGLMAVPVVFRVAGRYSRLVEDMCTMASRVAAGNFSGPRLPPGTGELGDLTAALNTMSTQLETRLRELAAEKDELATVLAGMTEGVLVAGLDGRLRLLNRALREQLQVGDEALGKTVLEVFRNPELEQVLVEPGPRQVTFALPVERTFAVNAARLAGNSGTVVVFHDVTRLNQLENLRKEFVANVSHELRTPLSIIKGYIETLLDDQPPDPATAQRFLRTIQKHAGQLENLIEDLLSISALESQRTKIEFTTVSLPDLAAAVIEELSAPARTKSITVEQALPNDLPFAWGERQRLHQVLVNLLDNAIKYTPAGGRVVVTGRVVGKEIECCVADNGPGIAAEHLPRVFERFYRVDKARSRELGGTGLGLSIVKHIVQAHGGRVWAESEEGCGSRFYFTVPHA